MESPFVREDFLPEASVALAGSSNPLIPSTPVEIASERRTTLYLLPAHSIEVKCPPYTGQPFVLPSLAAFYLGVKNSSPLKGGRG
jgi:hypothetical protein